MKKLIYCMVMSRLWTVGYKLYTWCEDRRPGGGFHVKNIHTIPSWRWRKYA